MTIMHRAVAIEADPNESYMPSRRNSGRHAGRVNRYEDNPQMKLVIMQPVSFEEARDIANHLKERKPIVINLEAVDNPTSRRIVRLFRAVLFMLWTEVLKKYQTVFF